MATAGAHADVVVVFPWSRDGAVETKRVSEVAIATSSERIGGPEAVPEGAEINPELVVAKCEEVASRAPRPAAEDRVEVD